MPDESKQDDRVIPHDQHPVSSSPRGDATRPTQVSIDDTTTTTDGGNDADLVTFTFFFSPRDARFIDIFKEVKVETPKGFLTRGEYTNDQRDALAGHFANAIRGLTTQLAPGTSKGQLTTLYDTVMDNVPAPDILNGDGAFEFAHRDAEHVSNLSEVLAHVYDNMPSDKCSTIYADVPKAVTDVMAECIFHCLRAEKDPGNDVYLRVRGVLPDELQTALDKYRLRQDVHGNRLSFYESFAFGPKQSILFIDKSLAGTVNHSSPEEVSDGPRDQAPQPTFPRDEGTNPGKSARAAVFTSSNRESDTPQDTFEQPHDLSDLTAAQSVDRLARQVNPAADFWMSHFRVAHYQTSG